MKTTCLLFSIALLFISALSFSQNGYEMKEGEKIVLDENGKIVGSNLPSVATSKINPGTKATTGVERISVYNEDGTFKIPGYVPTGNKEVDEQNYKKAKLLLYQENQQEYQKWFGEKTSNIRIKVRLDEWKKMPDIKKDYILAHPEKYYIDDSDGIPDCNQ